MKHRYGHKKLNKPTDQRVAMLRNLAYSLVSNGKIVTTTTRAKELKRYIEKIISISKTDSVHSRRKVHKFINNKKFISLVFEKSKSFKDRNGGYTRLIKVGFRKVITPICL